MRLVGHRGAGMNGPLRAKAMPVAALRGISSPTSPDRMDNASDPSRAGTGTSSSAPASSCRLAVPEGVDDLEERIRTEVALSDATYFLPSDSGERKRLHVQHIVNRHLFGGLFHTPQNALFEDPTADAKILDVGCGPGSWTLEMAVKFPHASFVGGDIISYDYRNLPSNVVFKTENALTGLSYDNIGHLSTSAGLLDVKERFAVFPFGWNGPLGNLAATDFKQLVTGASKQIFMAGRDETTYAALVEDAFKQAVAAAEALRRRYSDAGTSSLHAFGHFPQTSVALVIGATLRVLSPPPPPPEHQQVGVPNQRRLSVTPGLTTAGTIGQPTAPAHLHVGVVVALVIVRATGTHAPFKVTNLRETRSWGGEGLWRCAGAHSVGLLDRLWYVPVLSWLPRYSVRANLEGDVVAGMTALSYAEALVKIPLVYGRCTCFVPLIVYSMLGTSRQLGVGPEALVSILVGAAISEKSGMKGGGSGGGEDGGDADPWYFPFLIRRGSRYGAVRTWSTRRAANVKAEVERIEVSLVIGVEEGLFFGNTGQLKERLNRVEMYGKLGVHPGEKPHVQASAAAAAAAGGNGGLVGNPHSHSMQSIHGTAGLAGSQGDVAVSVGPSSHITSVILDIGARDADTAGDRRVVPRARNHRLLRQPARLVPAVVRALRLLQLVGEHHFFDNSATRWTLSALLSPPVPGRAPQLLQPSQAYECGIAVRKELDHLVLPTAAAAGACPPKPPAPRPPMLTLRYSSGALWRYAAAVAVRLLPTTPAAAPHAEVRAGHGCPAARGGDLGLHGFRRRTDYLDSALSTPFSSPSGLSTPSCGSSGAQAPRVSPACVAPERSLHALWPSR
ncbi:Solute carrier 26, partial [Cladochytrium tenue]